MRKILLILLLLCVPTLCLAQQTLTFQWDPHPEAAVITGFKLYQAKQSGNYAAPVATFTGGNLTEGIIPKPASPGRYYWVLRAFVTDPAGGDIESGNSNEVTDVVKPKEPTGFVKTAGETIAAVVAFPAKGLKSLFARESGFRLKN